MRRCITVVLAAAALFAVSCDNSPTELTEQNSPLFNAGQGPDKGMSLIWAVPYEGSPDYFSCFNGGEGEDILASGYIEFWARTVETPSGNFKQHGEFRGYENYLGVKTGDLWEGLSLVVPTIFYNTRHSDGHTIVNEPVWNYAQNQRTGEIVRIKWNFFLELDEVGNYLRADVKITNCMPWKGQIH